MRQTPTKPERRPATGIYLHTPFCREICPYCDFTVARPQTGQGRRFVERLCQRLEAASSRGPFADRQIASVYLGGGTPSLLPLAGIARILQTIRAGFALEAEAEITLEANPESVNPRRIEAWLSAGVNRISLGVQALDDPTLGFLGRTHRAAQAASALALLRRAGLRSLAADLIAGVPAQDSRVWRQGVRRLLEIGVDHLSVYGLTLHAGTPFGDQQKRGELMIDEDEQAERYEEGVELAEAAGLARYEVSNLARPGHRSRHNRIYWDGDDYLGLGPGAASHLDGLRWREDPDLRAHLGVAEPARESERLSLAQRQLELIMLGLRRVHGVDGVRFRALGGGSIEAVVPRSLNELSSSGMLLAPASPRAGWRLEPRHLLLADAVAERFVAELGLEEAG